MNVTIRAARPEDAEVIGGFTADTFEWGDYITEVLPHWMASENGKVIVAADQNDQPVALGRAVMMSPTEAWLQGFRVQESCRRRGIASAIVEALVEWGESRGAQVARLLTEGWNDPAQRQVEKTGFKHVSSWIVGTRKLAGQKPAAPTNGGRRAKARRKLELAHSSEAIPAWVSWRSGLLVRPARGLHVDGWRWAQLSAEHLIAAGKKGALWSSQAGWITTRRDGDNLYIDFVECGPDDADDLIRSIVDLTFEQHAERVRITAPEVDWLVASLERSGCEIHSMLIYERPL